MSKYNEVFDGLNKRIETLTFQSALNLGLICCLQDLHYFFDYLNCNNISENPFEEIEKTLLDILKRRYNIKNNYTDKLELCENILDSFLQDENDLYDECVNLCCEIMHLIKYISSKDNRHIFEITKIWFENKEAYTQKNTSNSDEIIDNILNQIPHTDFFSLTI